MGGLVMGFSAGDGWEGRKAGEEGEGEGDGLGTLQ